MNIPTDELLAELVGNSADLMRDRSIGLPLAEQAAGLKIVDVERPTILNVKVCVHAQLIPAPDGFLPEKITVIDDGSPIGILMFRVVAGKLDEVEFSWFFEKTPDRWPRPGELASGGD